jgi:hypothetical protein
MNALLSFIALFVLAYIQIRPPAEKQEAVLETDGIFAVVLQWSDESADDVDLFVMDPAGSVAYFSNASVGLMHLEHDDLGKRNDVLSSGSQSIRVQKNEERTIIRGVVPGEYVVNVLMYRKEDSGTTPVTVRLYRLRGEDAPVIEKQLVLTRSGDERTVFRFTPKDDGTVSNINELPKPLFGRTRGDRMQGGGQ